MRTKHLLSLGLIFVLLLSLLPFQRVEATYFTVGTSSGDTDGDCHDGDCSLGDAITEANNHVGADYIEFDIDAPDPHCVDGLCTIYPSDEFPWLLDDETTINGYSQTGAARATDSSTAIIKIAIDGSYLTVGCDNVLNLQCNGLIIASSHNVVEGLSIYSFHNNAIAIGNADTSLSADSNVIKGNYIGVSTLGTTTPGNGLDGVFIGFNAEFNTIGGNDAAERNIISGNNIGVEIWSSSATYHAAYNLILGNYIGADHTGTVSLPNTLDGIRIYGRAHNNTVGGNITGERNVIVGNGRSGVRILGAGTNQNTVAGNYIGLNKSGSTALPNHTEGVYIGQGAKLNTVGGNATGWGNVISGNVDSGVILTGTNTTSNTVSGNLIGLNYLGLGTLGNSGSGVYLYNASHNQIGGDTEAERNYISGNYNGITLYGAETHENVISGNYIGVGVIGTWILSNLHAGVSLNTGAHDNRIGGSTVGERNVISGNDLYGIELNASVTSNDILGNYIGTDNTGMLDKGNDSVGVLLHGATNNTVGGATLDEFNVISGNNSNGVRLDNGASGNTVAGNIIGLTAELSSALPNNASGVSITSDAHDNVIGGTVTDQPLNYICSNNGDGVQLSGANITLNEISGNMIGMEGFGNNGAGITIFSGAHDNTIGGGESQKNYIGYNHQYGIAIDGEGSDNNIITDSEIEQHFLGGVLISDGENNRIGPNNSIQWNGADGVWIVGSATTGNVVTESSIKQNINSGIDLEDHANGDILPPEITSQTLTTVSGTACANCTVELFASGDVEGEGWEYVNKTVATGSGVFTVTITTLPYPYLTATATDATDGTSEFSGVFTSIYHFYYIFLPIITR